MSLLHVICLLISLIAMIVALLPFFVGEGGMLQEARLNNSKASLVAIKEQLLTKWLEDEASFESKVLTKREWELRKNYLTSRYIDVVRRLDFVSKSHEGNDL